jgi:pyridinium-3,5-biscarboxylic acid mononucleotide sulfurtransferase
MEPATFSAAPDPSAALSEKLRCCRHILCRLEGAVVAFSGGVDSTLLVALAAEAICPARVVAAVGLSPSLPEAELSAARDLARQIGVELVEVETLEMENPAYAANSAKRCFHCKHELFMRLKRLAAERGLPAVVAGANADDLGDFRPGLEAAMLLGVRNPLLEAGLTKTEVRQASRELGLATWDKPSMACLASRMPYGRPITAAALKRIEAAEIVVRQLGFAACRVRDHDPIARIEVPAEDLSRLLERRKDAVAALKALGYAYVALDLQGLRSGSMNEVLHV